MLESSNPYGRRFFGRFAGSPPAGFCVAALAAIAIGAGCETSVDLTTCQGIVQGIAAGAQAVKPDGSVTLTGAAASMTVDGMAYVTRRPDGSWYVLFRTWQGKGANLRGVLYASAPFPRVPTSVDLVVPVPAPARPTTAVDIEVERQISPGWYEVSRSLD